MAGTRTRGYRRRPFLARFREDDRRALLRPVDFRLREDPRALFRADRRPPFLADFRPRLAVLRVDFLARLADRLAVFLRRVVDLRVVLAGVVGEGSLKSPNDEDVEAGGREGVFSIGSGSIHPEPDQPISI
jgi:hypothetical protein